MAERSSPAEVSASGVQANVGAVVAEVARRLVAPGAFFTGSERRAIAMYARASRGLADRGAGLRPEVARAVERIAPCAWTCRASDVEAWVGSGDPVEAYVEVVSIVSVVCAIDSFTFGMGMPITPLPSGSPGPVTGSVVADAEFVDSWVPTVGPGSATMALSGLPDEMAINRHMQQEWYLSDDAIFDFDTEPARALSRQQIELLAARTSAINDCFY